MIAVDAEGMPGICAKSECDREHADYPPFNAISTEMVVATARGAIAGGATEVWVMDWHSSARNIDVQSMPNGVHLVRGWTETPNGMVDTTFDGAAFIGYHSEANNPGNPLSQTKRFRIDYIKLDGNIVGEFETDSRMTGCFGVPTILIAGDEALTSRYTGKFAVVPMTRGIGGAIVMPGSVSEIKDALFDAMKKAVERLVKPKSKPTKPNFGGKVDVEIKYRKHIDALRASHYPGAVQIDANTVKVACDNYHDAMCAFMFLT